MKIHKDDKVIVITGKDKGKTGSVSLVIPEDDRVVVTGVNVRKVHQRPRKSGEKGQIIEKTMPIHVSNVMLTEGGKRVRVSSKVVDGKKIRVSRKSGNAI
jgi:large subunit ribosomal protein L24